MQFRFLRITFTSVEIARQSGKASESKQQTRVTSRRFTLEQSSFWVEVAACMTVGRSHAAKTAVEFRFRNAVNVAGCVPTPTFRLSKRISPVLEPEFSLYENISPSPAATRRVLIPKRNDTRSVRKQASVYESRCVWNHRKPSNVTKRRERAMVSPPRCSVTITLRSGKDTSRTVTSFQVPTAANFTGQKQSQNGIESVSGLKSH